MKKQGEVVVTDKNIPSTETSVQESEDDNANVQEENMEVKQAEDAFAITAVPDMYARFLEEPEISAGRMTSSFWYLSGDTCTNIYFKDMDAFITLEHGVLDDGTISSLWYVF